MQQSFKKGKKKRKKKRKDQAWLEKSLKSCVCGHGFHFIPRLLFEGRKENKTAGTDSSVHCRSAFKHLFFFLSFLLLSLSLYNHVLESSSTIVRLQSSRDKPCVFICMSSRCFSLHSVWMCSEIFAVLKWTFGSCHSSGPWGGSSRFGSLFLNSELSHASLIISHVNADL